MISVETISNAKGNNEKKWGRSNCLGTHECVFLLCLYVRKLIVV